jgi:hypothetical protein
MLVKHFWGENVFRALFSNSFSFYVSFDISLSTVTFIEEEKPRKPPGISSLKRYNFGFNSRQIFQKYIINIEIK